MIEFVKKVILRFRTQLAYLVAGVMTTAINYLVYLLLIGPLRVHYIAANGVAWAVAVLFAYFANRVWVFRSKNPRIFAEIWLFAASRVFSLLLETGLLYVAVELLGAGEKLSKAVMAVVVIVCNYITGKLVFKSK